MWWSARTRWCRFFGTDVGQFGACHATPRAFRADLGICAAVEACQFDAAPINAVRLDAVRASPGSVHAVSAQAGPGLAGVAVAGHGILPFSVDACVGISEFAFVGAVRAFAALCAVTGFAVT